MNKIIIITGPTGVGKTKLSIMLAKKLNAIIINADAMQIYQDLNIGTAKIKESEKQNIPHYLLNIKTVFEEYTIYDYQKDVRNIIKNNPNRVIILVGGTGLYIKSALFDYKFENEKINNQYNDLTTEELYQKLKNLDQKIAISKYNRPRIIRAINYYLNNNKSIANNKEGNKLLYDAVFIGLTTDREKLYSIINNRVDQMIKDGLIDEAKSFYDRNIYTKPLINGIGYKELYKYFNKESTLEESINLIKKNSRHYAKRQYTYFNNQLPVKWFKVNFNDFNSVYLNVNNYLEKESITLID